MKIKKYYNIEGVIRNGFKLSRNYETLDFNFIKLGDPGVAALCRSRSIKDIRRLTLTQNNLGPSAAESLSRSYYLGKLEHFKIYNNQLGDEGVKRRGKS